MRKAKSEPGTDPQNSLLIRVLLLICGGLLAIFLISFCLINFLGFTRFLNADMYEDTIVARYMWEQRTLFPTNWVFGNQFYVFATPTLAALVYGICGSINTAMAVATSIMTVLIFISFLWMMHPVAGWDERLLGLLALVAAVMGPVIVNCIEGQILFVMASYYAGYLVALLIGFGTYIRLYEGETRLAILIPVALSMVLVFMTGMQSLRQTMLEIVPMFAVTGFTLLVGLIRHRGSQWIRSKRPVCFFTLAIALSNLSGILLIKLLAPPQNTIYGELSISNAQKLLGNLEVDGRAIRSITGLKYLFEDMPTRLLGIAAVVFIVLVLFAIIGSFRLPRKLVVLHGLLLWSVAGPLLVTTFFNISLRGIYLFSWCALAGVSAVMAMRLLQPIGRQIVAVFLIFCAVVNLYLGYYPCIRGALDKSKSRDQEIAEYLVQERYTILYGDWWRTCHIAGYTDGAVVCGSWNGAVFETLGYINTQDIYEESDTQRAAIFLTEQEREEALAYAASQGVELELIAEYGADALYTSSIQLMHPAEGP